MIVYSGLKSDFLFAVEQDSIAAQIEETIYDKMHRHTSQNEFRSWENSLEYMYKVLNDRAIPESPLNTIFRRHQRELTSLFPDTGKRKILML